MVFCPDNNLKTKTSWNIYMFLRKMILKNTGGMGKVFQRRRIRYEKESMGVATGNCHVCNNGELLDGGSSRASAQLNKDTLIIYFTPSDEWITKGYTFQVQLKKQTEADNWTGLRDLTDSGETVNGKKYILQNLQLEIRIHQKIFLMEERRGYNFNIMETIVT